MKYVKLSLKYKFLVYLSTLIPKIKELNFVNSGEWVNCEIIWLARVYVINHNFNTPRITIVELCGKEERE